MTEALKLANAGPWDGDNLACTMCAGAVATWCVGGEGWCADCLARAAINAVAGETARAEKAEAAMAEAAEVLRDYADTFCEHSPYEEVCGHLSRYDCSGCKARAILARLTGDA